MGGSLVTACEDALHLRLSVASVALRVNPFDEPDVHRSKDTTALFLKDKNAVTQTPLTPLFRDGDLSLIGRPIKGKITAVKPGHKNNTKFAKQLKGDYDGTNK